MIKIAAKKGWNQGDLQTMAGLSHARITRWKDRKGEPTVRQALRIARLLNVPLEWLADDDAPDEPVAAEPVFSPDEIAILSVIHGLGLSVQEVVARLMGPDWQATKGAAHETTVGREVMAAEKDAARGGKRKGKTG